MAGRLPQGRPLKTISGSPKVWTFHKGGTRTVPAHALVEACFTADTPVVVADGYTRPIARVKEGR